MAQYIDEKDVYALVEPRGMARVHCSQIDELPRADVVPISEVKELKRIYRTYNKAIKNERAEVAREIFEEIEKASERWEAIYSPDHFGYGGSAYGYLETDVEHTIAVLKKKYTEVKDG